MDFSWVRELADQSNQQELARQDRDRRQKENQKTAALSTCSFVEKLHVVITGATEEFNKHCVFAHLRVQNSKLYKHSKTKEDNIAEPDEVAYFTFQRLGYMYGIRGVNGCVDFLQIPVGEGMSMSIKLDELPMTAHKTLKAEMEPDSRKIRWVMDGAPMDGPAIVSLCQKFFIDLIVQTNSEIE